MAEGEDPFGSLIKFCQATSSQELKFRSCSFARESETSPDYFDSLATSSPDPTPLDPVGIVIVSPPETDSENNSSIDKSNTQENEYFLTPPEHHNPSASSSQEEHQRLKQVTPSDSKLSVSVVAETTAGDDEHVENEASVDLRKGEKNLGFSETEKIDSCDGVLEGQCWDSVKEVGGIEGFECELKRFRDFDSKLDKTVSKKIRVLEENWDSDLRTLCKDRTEINDKMNNTEIIDLDTEGIDKEIKFDEGKIIIDVDTSAEDSEKNAEVRERGEAWENVQEVSDATAESVEESGKSEKRGSDGDPDHSEKENGVDLDGGEKFLKVNGNLVLEDSEEGVRDKSNNEVQRDGKAVSGSSSIENHGKFRCGGPGNGVDNSAQKRVARGRHKLPSSIKDKDMGGEESIGYTEEVEKSKNSGSYNDVNQREKEQGVACNGGDRRLEVNGTVELAESEKGIRHKSNNKVQRDGKAVLSSSIMEKIDKFRYESPDNGVNHSAKERAARVRRELPPSIRGKEKDMGGEESGGYVKVKNGSWKDLVDALEVVFGKVDDGCKELDFLETAKMRGLTFPEPRWIDD